MGPQVFHHDSDSTRVAQESMEMSWARKEAEPAGNIMLYGIGQRLAKEGLPTKAQEPWHEKSL